MYLGNGCLRRCKCDLLLTFNRPPHHPQIRHHTCTTQQRFIPTLRISSFPHRTSKAALLNTEKKKEHECMRIFITRTHLPTPAFKWQLWIFIASIGVESAPSINDYWWCRRIVRKATTEGKFSGRESAQGHSTQVWILRQTLEVPTSPWFISPFPAYVCMMSYGPA